MRMRKISAIICCISALFMFGCAAPSAPDAQETAGAAIRMLNDARSVTLTNDRQRLVTERKAQRRDVRLYEGDALIVELSDALYLSGECVAPLSLPLLADVETLLDLEEVTVSGDAHTASITFDGATRLNAVIKALCENRNARLGACLDAVLSEAFPESRPTARQYKDALCDKLQAAGTEPLETVLEPGIFALADRLADKSENAAAIAAFLREHRTSTVNDTFLDLLELLSPGGDPVKPETAVKVLLDTFYSKYLNSNKYTLKTLSEEFGLPLYAFAEQLAMRQTAVEAATVQLSLTLNDIGVPTEGKLTCALRATGWPNAENGILEKTYSIDGMIAIEQ